MGESEDKSRVSPPVPSNHVGEDLDILKVRLDITKD